MPDVPLIVAAEQVADAGGLDTFIIVTTLLGGLALFLHGMDRLTDALRVIAGDRMRTILGRLTSNRFVGVLTGAGVTAVIQSSSVTTVLVVGFITSGLMTLTQAIGVIMGSNIGTTITAQIISLNVSRYALLVVALGFAASFFAKERERQYQGRAVMGLGLVFFGMGVMGDAMSPLRTFEPFTDWMVSLGNPVVGIVSGLVFTALIQSSSATTGLVIVLAGQGLISLEAGIAVILGANIGTSVTALLAAIGKPREALRAGLAHTLFNVAGVLMFLPLLGFLASAVRSIGGGVAREIANAHTIFNVTATVVFVGFTSQFARLVARLVPDRPDVIERQIKAKYLDAELLRTPALAIDRARLELLRMADRVRTMIAAILPAVLKGPRPALADVESMDDEVDALHGHIITYLSMIGREDLSDADSDELVGLMDATNNLEAIGDIIETNLVTLGYARIDDNVTVSPSTRAVIGEFHAAVARAFDMAMVALTQRNLEEARRVSAMKDEINSLERAAAAHQAKRLTADEPKRVEAYRFEMDVIANLKRIFYFTKRTARVAVPAEDRATS